jgi:ankyrin repeat protein
MSRDLFDAMKAGDLPRFTALLGADPALAGARSPEGTSALLTALFLMNPDHETFQRAQANPYLHALLAHRPPLDVFDAAIAGDADRMRALLDANQASARSFHPVFGTTPLHLAAFAGRVEVTELLLARGAEVDAISKNKFRNTPLVMAALPSQRETSATLLDHGADANREEEGGYRALHIAAVSNDAALVTMLLDHGAVIDAAADDGTTALALAEKRSRPEACAALRARGAR